MKNFVRTLKARFHRPRGNIMVYIVMVMLIFGILGATMVSLFSTSLTSSSTPNDSRRAYYTYESAMRYAASELVNNTPEFSSSTINTLNANPYKIDADKSFTLKVFGLDFRSLQTINDDTVSSLNLKLDKGMLPDNFTIPTSDPYNIFLVNYQAEDLGNLQPDAVSAINLFTRQDATHVNVSLVDTFIVAENEQVAFAVHPYQDDSISQGGDLLLNRDAASIFPRKNGVIRVGDKNYYYSDRVDTEDPNYTKLTNIQNPTNKNPADQFPLNVSAASTYVILSPVIHIITAVGESGQVSYTEEWNKQYGGTAYVEAALESRKPDIEFEEEQFLDTKVGGPTTTGFVNVDNLDKSIIISGSSGFGSAWFKDTRPIGGVRNYCQAGGCYFKRGFRAFFILNFSGGNGDGLTFSAINGTNNDTGSVGGDVDLSELLAYAGDSRNVSSPTSAADFLDGRSGEGLLAPKMAVEFDGKTNNQSQTICHDSTTVNLGSRFDPDFGGVDRDTVQYVFWGKNSSIFAPCRNNPLTGTNKTYDDNRHDSVNAIWIYDSGSVLVSSPAIDDSDPANIKIFTGRSTETTQNDGGRFIRLRPSDGTANPPGWTRNPDTTAGNDDDINSSPSLDSSGDIYIGNDSFLISKYNSSGSKLWSTTLDGNIEGQPFVSNIKNRVYVVTDNGTLYSLNTAGTIQWSFDIGSTAGDYTSSPAVRYDSGLDKNVIYVGALNSSLYVVRDDGATASLVREYTTPSDQIRSTPAINPLSGNVYFGSDDNKLYALTPQGTGVWAFTTGGDVVSSPAVAPDGATVYVGSSDGHLYALNTLNGFKRWQYPASGTIGAVESSPAVYAGDGTIYFGSNDGHLYALNPDGTLQWKFPTAGSIGPIKGKPARAADGIIYFGSEGKLYAIDPAANDPPNLTYPNFYLTPVQLDPAGSYTNNWLTDNPWAVRVEVERSQTPNGSGKYEYTLRTWLKKCTDADCLNLLGGFFQNTRFKYGFANESTPITPLSQTIELSNQSPDFFHDLFERFLFGFTSASTAPQTIEILKFQLSFIRPNDPVAND